MKQSCELSTGNCVDEPTPGCGGCTCTNDVCTKTLCDAQNACLPSTFVNCSSLLTDTCTTADPCDPKKSAGCVFNTIDCTAVLPTSSCHQVVKDPTAPGCCIQKLIDCNAGDPCKNYFCDASGCQSNDKCISNDLCVIPSCGANGCIFTSTVCDPPNGCYLGNCDSATGKCVFVDGCDDNDLCTLDSCVNGACENVAIDCDDGDACTLNSCVNGDCSSTALDCDDGIECTLDSCDSTSGCANIPDSTICNSPDPCVIKSCDKTQGCIDTPVTCPGTGSFCLLSSCIAYEGCANQSYVCNSQNRTCVFTECVEEEDETKRCRTTDLVCVAVIDTAVIVAATASAISAAVIAGIIVGIILFGGVTTGATLAYLRRYGDDSVAHVGNNPLFVSSGLSGTNPIAKV
jgi:hypothetical protein